MLCNSKKCSLPDIQVLIQKESSMFMKRETEQYTKKTYICS